MSPLRMRSTHPTMSLSSSPSSSSTIAQQTDSHTCDTLPRARPSSPSRVVSDDHWSSHPPSPSSHPTPDLSPSALSSQPTPRKLCIRHQRIADEGTNLKLQQVRPIPLPSFRNGFRPSLYLITCSGRHILMCSIYAFFFVILSLGPRRPSSRRKRIHQCNLVKLFIISTLSPRAYSSGHPDDVLLLSTFTPH
jgi:hypothetical protein